MKNSESLFTVDSALFAEAQTVANAANRNVSEQIALWANLGQLLESMLTNSEVSALMNGAIGIKVVASNGYTTNVGGHVDIVELAMSHQSESSFNKVASQIKKEIKGPVYETVDGRSEFLRQILPDGTVAIGILKNNKFKDRRSV
jgi:hypothetical protein